MSEDKTTEQQNTTKEQTPDEKLRKLINDPYYGDEKAIIQEVRNLQKEGANLDEIGGELLHEAIKQGSCVKVTALLECDVDPNSKQWNDQEQKELSAFEHCCVAYRRHSGNFLWVAYALADYGADVTTVETKRPGIGDFKYIKRIGIREDSDFVVGETERRAREYQERQKKRNDLLNTGTTIKNEQYNITDPVTIGGSEEFRVDYNRLITHTTPDFTIHVGGMEKT